MTNSFAAVALAGALTLAQSASTIAPLRTAPIEKFTVNPGHRDWTPTVLSGTTIIGGNSSNRGGLFAVDTIAGKLKWAFRPTGTASGNPFVATTPAVSGGVAIAPMGNTLVAVTVATGREAWRGPATAQSAAVAADGGLAFVLGQGRIVYQGGKPVEQTPVLPGGHLNAIDLATRSVLWTFSRPTAEANWPFGYVTPVDGGLWVDSYQALVKLQ